MTPISQVNVFIGLYSLDREYLEHLLWIRTLRFTNAVLNLDSTVNVGFKNERQKCSAVFANDHIIIPALTCT